MADCIEDSFISTRYAKIARDEGFHSKIGEKKLLELCEDADVQARVEAIADAMRMDLYAVSCMNTKELPEARKIIEDAYVH